MAKNRLSNHEIWKIITEAIIEEKIRLLAFKKPVLPKSIVSHLVKKSGAKTCSDCGNDYIGSHNDCPFKEPESMGFELLPDDSPQLMLPSLPDDECSCDKQQQALASIPLRPDGRCARCGGR